MWQSVARGAQWRPEGAGESSQLPLPWSELDGLDSALAAVKQHWDPIPAADGAQGAVGGAPLSPVRRRPPPLGIQNRYFLPEGQSPRPARRCSALDSALHNYLTVDPSLSPLPVRAADTAGHRTSEAGPGRRPDRDTATVQSRSSAEGPAPCSPARNTSRDTPPSRRGAAGRRDGQPAASAGHAVSDRTGWCTGQVEPERDSGATSSDKHWVQCDDPQSQRYGGDVPVSSHPATHRLKMSTRTEDGSGHGR